MSGNSLKKFSYFRTACNGFRNVNKNCIQRVLLICFTIPLILLNGCADSSINEIVRESLNFAKTGDNRGWKKALKNVEICIRRGVKNSDLITFYILCLSRTGNDGKALETGLELVSRDPNNFLGNYLIGKLYFDRENYPNALPYLQKCRELNPDHLNTLILLLKTAAKLNLPVLKELYIQLLTYDEFKKSFLVYNNLGCWYANHDDFPHAFSNFSQALQYSNGHPLVFLNMAILNDYGLNNEKVAQRYYLNFLYKAKDNYPDKSQKVLARLQIIGKKWE